MKRANNDQFVLATGEQGIVIVSPLVSGDRNFSGHSAREPALPLSAPHDRHKRAKAERRTTRTHFLLAAALLIVTANNFLLLAAATLPQTYTLTGNSAVVPPAVAPL